MMNPIKNILKSARISLVPQIYKRFTCSYDATNCIHINEVFPEIHRLLGSDFRQHVHLQSRAHLQCTEPSADDLPYRQMSDSCVSVLIPLETDASLQQRYASTWGQVRNGRLLEDMDKLSVLIVLKHLKLLNLSPEDPLPYVILTALVEDIRFKTSEAVYNKNIQMNGQVNWVGQTSVEVAIRLHQQLGSERVEILRALFLMTARDAVDSGKLIVNPLVACNAEEQTLIDAGAARRQIRLGEKGQNVVGSVPNPDEHRIIHNIFKTTFDKTNVGWKETVLPAGALWMETIHLSNTIHSHPENQYAYKNMFGGYLMRESVELGTTLAWKLSAKQSRLIHISNIRFLRPIKIESFVNMRAHVVYTDQQYIQIVVLIEANGLTHDVLNLTFANESVVPEVLPKTYHEAMWYLEGRRHCMATIQQLDLNAEC